MKVGDLVRYDPGGMSAAYSTGWNPEIHSSIGLILEIVDTAATVKWSSNGRTDFMTCPLEKLDVINEAG